MTQEKKLKYLSIISYLLYLMILWDFSLHVAELININENYFFWISFDTRFSYTVFWSMFWGIGTILSGMIANFHLKNYLLSFKSSYK